MDSGAGGRTRTDDLLMTNPGKQRLRARQAASNQGVFVQNESERRPFVPLASHNPSHTVWAGHVVVVVPEAQA